VLNSAHRPLGPGCGRNIISDSRTLVRADERSSHDMPGSLFIPYGRTFSGSAHTRGPGHSRASCRPRTPRSISNRTSKCTEDSGTAHDKEFEDYFNAAGEKTLRAYTVSLNLAHFDRQDWLARDETMDLIAEALDTIRKVPLLTARMARRLLPVDPRALEAGLLGSNPAGLFKP
jgi:hypothetical protein